MRDIPNLTSVRKVVYQNKKTRQKSVSIPLDCNIEGGDLVDIFLIKKSKNNKENETAKTDNLPDEMAIIKTTKKSLNKGESQ